MTNNKLKELREQLEKEKEFLIQEVIELSSKLDFIKRKLGWVSGNFRYGDIVEVSPTSWPTGSKEIRRHLVVVGISKYNNYEGMPVYEGVPIKEDGTLGVNRQLITLGTMVGHYEGDDLFGPDLAAQFGLDHRKEM